MEIITQINVVLLSNQQLDHEHQGCKAYIEEIPQLCTSGKTLAEAEENLIFELKKYEKETYSRYSIVEYKFKASAFI